MYVSDGLDVYKLSLDKIIGGLIEATGLRYIHGTSARLGNEDEIS
jgi:hypothetical protein